MKKSLFLIVFPFLAACSTWQNPVSSITNSITPHHVEIQQGNVVTQEMLFKLKVGMTPSQVRFVMGTPLVVDPFHAERWDYVYSLRKGGETLQKRHITVVFANNKLAGVEGDVALAPAEQPSVPEEVKK